MAQTKVAGRNPSVARSADFARASELSPPTPSGMALGRAPSLRAEGGGLEGEAWFPLHVCLGQLMAPIKVAGRRSDVARSAGFARASELCLPTPRLRAEGGGLEGEPWFPLHVCLGQLMAPIKVAGRGSDVARSAGFARASELSLPTPRLRAEGGGLEGEPWFPLHI
jgi:hypothetical protein